MQLVVWPVYVIINVQVKDGMLVLDTSLQHLKSQSKAGIDSVSQGAFQLDEKGSELFAGSVQVDDGMNQLASSLSSLEDLKAGLVSGLEVCYEEI